MRLPFPHGLRRPSLGDADNPRPPFRLFPATLSDDLDTRIYAFIANCRIRNTSDEQRGNMLAVPAKIAKQNVIGAFHRVPCNSATVIAAAPAFLCRA
nr:hypothetical protein [Paraburkholderia guartelaensis]